jgi:ATP-binding cassette subfamily B protein
VIVAGIFYFKFGWEIVAATAETVTRYIWLTRTITEWRTKLRAQMNDLDGLALAARVDSLLNYETVKYFGAEKRELKRYGAAARAYAEAAIKSENSLGLLNIGPGADHEPDDGGAMAFTVLGLERRQLQRRRPGADPDLPDAAVPPARHARLGLSHDPPGG